MSTMTELEVLSDPLCPSVVHAAQDVPWERIGDVAEDRFPGGLVAVCRCRRMLGNMLTESPALLMNRKPTTAVHLSRYVMSTGRIVYWGQCHNCKRVFWATTGEA